MSQCLSRDRAGQHPMRRVLRFKRGLLDLVLEGRKTATIRPAEESGYARNLILTDGHRRIEAELVSVKKLKLSDALRLYREEGFCSPGELRELFRRIYPQHASTQPSNVNHVQTEEGGREEIGSTLNLISSEAGLGASGQQYRAPWGLAQDAPSMRLALSSKISWYVLYILLVILYTI